jgi:Holliday junction resolvase RusA-like endonuclease
MRDAQLTLLDDDPPAPSTLAPGEVVIRFTIVGRPQQVGSKRAFQQAGKLILTDANRKAKPWMQAVRDAAAGVLPEGFELLRGAIEIRVTFHFARPKNHFRTGRNTGDVKRAAPHWHTSTPDCDKLCRSLGDALTGVVCADDRQIANWHAEKVYTAGSEGATVEIRELAEIQP